MKHWELGDKNIKCQSCAFFKVGFRSKRCVCGWLQIGLYCPLSLLEFICQGHLQYLSAGWNTTLNKYFSYFPSDFFIWDDCRRVRYQIKIYLDHPKPLMRRTGGAECRVCHYCSCLFLDIQGEIFLSKWSPSCRPHAHPQTIISRDIVCCQNQKQEEQKSRAEPESRVWIHRPQHWLSQVLLTSSKSVI